MRQPVLKRNRAQPCIGRHKETLQEVLVSAPNLFLRDIIMLELSCLDLLGLPNCCQLEKPRLGAIGSMQPT